MNRDLERLLRRALEGDVEVYEALIKALMRRGAGILPPEANLLGWPVVRVSVCDKCSFFFRGDMFFDPQCGLKGALVFLDVSYSENHRFTDYEKEAHPECPLRGNRACLVILEETQDS